MDKKITEKRNTRARYRQENLERDWTEDWSRSVDESRMTPVQYLLLFLLVVMLAALIMLGSYWAFGRSTDRDGRLRGEWTAGEMNQKTEQIDDDIVILR